MVPIEGNIVKEYKIGKATIKISDAVYINQTSEDVERILDRIMEIGWKCVYAARAKGIDV